MITGRRSGWFDGEDAGFNSVRMALMSICLFSSAQRRPVVILVVGSYVSASAQGSQLYSVLWAMNPRRLDK